MAIFITGDIHAKPERLSSQSFPQGKNLTKDDFVIICGDFGLIWDKEGTSTYEDHWLDWLNDKPFTTLFLDGNHENFDRLLNFETYPCEKWHGGIVQKIRPSVIHLMRGEIYDLQGKTFFCMGGNYSHDIQHGIIDPADYPTRPDMIAACKALEKKCGGWQFAMYRIKGESWWPQEVPTAAERDNAIRNLFLVDYKVDFILTHGLPSTDLFLMYKNIAEANEFEVWLEREVRQKVTYENWFSGHYHEDKAASYKDICVYYDFIQVV